MNQIYLLKTEHYHLKEQKKSGVPSAGLPILSGHTKQLLCEDSVPSSCLPVNQLKLFVF
jgi:hypothetical protein